MPNEAPANETPAKKKKSLRSSLPSFTAWNQGKMKCWLKDDVDVDLAGNDADDVAVEVLEDELCVEDVEDVPVDDVEVDNVDGELLVDEDEVIENEVDVGDVDKQNVVDCGRSVG